MKNLKNIFGWITLVAVVTFGTTFANAGIITAGLNGENTDKTSDPCVSTDNGIITAGFTGIITAGFTGIITAGLTGIITAGATGIITAGAKDDAPVNCGIITAG